MTGIARGANWIAAIAGTLAAYGVAWLRFRPLMFQRVWSAGSQGIRPPAKLPWARLAIQFAGTFLMAWLIGITARDEALPTATLLVLGIAVLQTGTSRPSQTSGAAAAVDGGRVGLMGVLMIAAQALF
jgi:hypothetical protein